MDEFACVKKDYLFLHDFQKDFDEDLKGELIIKMLITVILGDTRRSKMKFQLPSSSCVSEDCSPSMKMSLLASGFA